MPLVRWLSLVLCFPVEFWSLRYAVTTDAFNDVALLDENFVVVVHEDLKRSKGHADLLLFATVDFSIQLLVMAWTKVAIYLTDTTVVVPFVTGF